MTVLILSSEQDLHAQAVRRQLDLLNVQCAVFDIATLLQHSVTYKHSGNSFTTVCDGDSIDFGAVSAIWNRRPTRPRSPAMPEEWVEKLIEHETSRAFWGMLRTLDCLWVNHPRDQEEAAIKVNQLKLAREVGLRTPETEVTNDPAAAREFYERCDGRIIYKMIDELSALHFPLTEMPRGLNTMPVRDVDLSHLSQVQFCLHLFQQKIEKIADIRVTIVGAEVFAAKIESQQGIGQLDFRLDYSVPILNWELPPHVVQGCFALLEKFRLNFGAFDFCLDAHDNYFFLELNPAGQYLWVEEALGLGISAALARLLSGRRCP
jgi:glutathione synthase/RimK-type ligase-like ATP-grasp enzyme